MTIIINNIALFLFFYFCYVYIYGKLVECTYQ